MIKEVRIYNGRMTATSINSFATTWATSVEVKSQQVAGSPLRPIPPPPASPRTHAGGASSPFLLRSWVCPVAPLCGTRTGGALGFVFCGSTPCLMSVLGRPTSDSLHLTALDLPRGAHGRWMDVSAISSVELF